MIIIILGRYSSSEYLADDQVLGPNWLSYLLDEMGFQYIHMVRIWLEDEYIFLHIRAGQFQGEMGIS